MIRTLIGTDRLIDQERGQAFNLDTVLLAHFARVPYRTKLILDIGTGTGALMLYLSQKTKAKMIGIEIQKDRYERAKHNIVMNHLQDQLTCVHGDVKAHVCSGVDYIICNPPFFKVNHDSKLFALEEDQIARHETQLTLEQLIEKTASFLKQGGYFTMIHRPERFEEILRLCERHHLSMKRVRFVHPYAHKKANHVLIEAMKHGRLGLTIEPPLILYQDKHQLSEELIDIYGGVKRVTIPTKS